MPLRYCVYVASKGVGATPLRGTLSTQRGKKTKQGDADLSQDGYVLVRARSHPLLLRLCFAFPTPRLAGRIVMSSKSNSYHTSTAHAPTQPPFVRDAYYGFVTTRYSSFASVGRRLGIDTICPAMSFRSARLSSRSCATQATHSGACLHPLWTASIAFPSCSAQSN